MVYCCGFNWSDYCIFKFTEDSVKLSNEIMEEYNHVKALFISSLEILNNFENRIFNNLVDDIRKLILFYERTDVLTLSLVSEIFKSDFIENIEAKEDFFSLTNKILRLYFRFDVERIKNVKIFHDFSLINVYSHDKLLSKISKNELLKISTFSAMSLPMARQFLTHFYSNNFQLYNPPILSKKASIYVSYDKKERLKFICKSMCNYKKFKYVIVFFCGVYEKLFNEIIFKDDIKKLNMQEQSYFEHIKYIK